MFVFVLLASGSALLGLSTPGLAARSGPFVLQQKPQTSRTKKPSSTIDPRSVLAVPGVSRTPPPPPQQLHFQVITVPASARVGEVVMFTLQPVNLVPEYSRRLRFDFGDQSGIKPLEANQLGASHVYAGEGKYEFSVYVGDSKVSDPVIVVVGPWSLRPVPAQVDIGEELSFEIDNPPTDTGFEYRLHFDEDDSPTDNWSDKWQAGHRYHSAGPHKPYAEIRRVIDGSVIAAQTAPLQINVRELADTALQLTVVPNDTVQVDKEVKFTATLWPKFGKDDSHIRYRFVFGDNNGTEWQVKSETTHRYSLVGTHHAQVEVGWDNEQSKIPKPIATSGPHQINVTAIPRVSWWLRLWRDLKPYSIIIIPALAVIALAILFAGYQTWKGHFSVKPDYRAHRDIGIAQTTGGSLAIEFDIRLKPDVIDARYQLDVPEAGLIRYERRQHD